MGPGDLRSVLSGVKQPRRDRRVLVDHSTLDDAGVFAWGRGEALVQTVDFFTPVVDDPYDYGQIAAANALSDVYAMGGKPITALALLCLPDAGVPPEAVVEILRGGQDKMTEAGATILGGHTVRDPELKFGYAVTGVASRRRLLTNAGARPGDHLFLTKPLGTGVLSTALKQGKLGPAHLRRLTRSMAALNRVAAEVAVEFGARAATDITGYGLLGHASQLAEASGVTLRLRPERAWLLPRALECAREGLVPAGLAKNRSFYSPKIAAGATDPGLLDTLFDPQTSGGLLIAVPARRAAGLETALHRRRVWAKQVGDVLTKSAHAIVLEPAASGGTETP
ncbi:MAG: selenide, water dikinase SelD [Candidatus Eisenbacteria bacterium]